VNFKNTECKLEPTIVQAKLSLLVRSTCRRMGHEPTETRGIDGCGRGSVLHSCSETLRSRVWTVAHCGTQPTGSPCREVGAFTSDHAGSVPDGQARSLLDLGCHGYLGPRTSGCLSDYQSCSLAACVGVGSYAVSVGCSLLGHSLVEGAKLRLNHWLHR